MFACDAFWFRNESPKTGVRIIRFRKGIAINFETEYARKVEIFLQKDTIIKAQE